MRTASTSLTDFLVDISGKRRHVHQGRIEPKDETLRKILDYYGISYGDNLPKFPWSRKNGG
jgi:hypothetical protein